MLIANFNYFKEATIVNEVDIGGAPADGGDAGGGETPDFTGEPVSTVGNDGGVPADGGGDATPEDAGGGEETEDFTDDGENNDTDVPSEEGDTGGEETEDFTDDGGGDDMGGGDSGGDTGGDAGGGDVGGAPAGDGSIKADDARGLENEIFSDLTPTQIAVKHKELKNNFAAMHGSIDELIERVNEVNAADYQSAITFVSQQLSDLKQMIADYITDVYSTKSYMENAMNYNRFLATLNGIKEILDEVSNRIGGNDNSSDSPE